MYAWQMVSGDGIDALGLNEIPDRQPAHREVLVRMKASSINFRDYSIVSDPLARGIKLPRIPNSDGAGEVIAIGKGVRDVAVGDRVAGCFFQDWVDGPCSTRAMQSALGGAIDGVLAQQVIFSESGVVRIPDKTNFAEAATLPCAALTAWRAIVVEGQVKPGDTVLLLGTGGVSIFALQFATRLGARCIVTSSNVDKLSRARELGAWQTINYRERPEWDADVRAMTEGAGVDLVVEVGGAGTIARSVAATRVGGKVALIGVLTQGQFDPTPIMRKSITVSGIYVGSQRMFQEMLRAIDVWSLKPVIDERFHFAQAPAAFWAMAEARHFGKIVIEI